MLEWLDTVLIYYSEEETAAKRVGTVRLVRTFEWNGLGAKRLLEYDVRQLVFSHFPIDGGNPVGAIYII